MTAPSPTSQVSRETVRLSAGSAWRRAASSDSVSSPKNTVAVIRAQFFPAWLARAIQIHRPIPISPRMMASTTAAVSAECSLDAESAGFALWIAVRRLPMVVRVTIRLIALTAAPTYMSRTAFWIDGGGVGLTGSGSAPPLGHGWDQTLPGGMLVSA